MKRSVIILLLLSLLAHGAFGVDVFLGAELTVDFAKSQADVKDDAVVSPMDYLVWMSAVETNEAGNLCLGAGVSLLARPVEGGYPEPSLGWFIYAWWQPIEQLYMKIGQIDEDQRHWVYMTLMCDELHSNNMYVHPEFSYYNGFAGHVLGDGHGSFLNGLGGQKGFQISVFPIAGLTLNAGFAFAINGDLVKDMYINTLAVQAAYNIDGIGQMALGYRNAPEDQPKELAVQWDTSFTEAMKIQLGFRYLFEPKDAPKNPLDFGIGFGYGRPWADTFWLNARVGMSFGMEPGADNRFGVDVVASYDLGIFRLYLPVGVAMILPESGENMFAWNCSPYIKKVIGRASFWMGFLLFNGPRFPWQGELSKANRDDINWGIPFAVEWIW